MAGAVGYQQKAEIRHETDEVYVYCIAHTETNACSSLHTIVTKHIPLGTTGKR